MQGVTLDVATCRQERAVWNADRPHATIGIGTHLERPVAGAIGRAGIEMVKDDRPSAHARIAWVFESGQGDANVNRHDCATQIVNPSTSKTQNPE